MAGERNAVDWKGLGTDFYRHGDFANAIECYSRGLTKTAPLPVLLSNRAACHLKMGRNAQAVSDAGAARTIHPQCTRNAWAYEVAALLALGMCPVRTVDEAIAQYPQDAGLKKSMVDHRGKKEKGKLSAWWGVAVFAPLLSTLFGIDPNDAKAKGNDFFDQEKYDEASESYAAGLVGGDLPVATALLTNRALCSLALKDYAAAAADTAAALVLDANNEKAKFRHDKAKAGMLMQTSHSVENHEDMKRALMDKDGRASVREIEMAGHMLRMMGMDTLHNLPALHTEFQKHHGWPAGTDVDAALALLRDADSQARTVIMHRVNLLSDEFYMTDGMLLSRFGIRGPINAPPGVISRACDEIRLAYEPNLFHSFSNKADQIQILMHGETHVSVGFCDLGALLVAKFAGPRPGHPLQYHGVDMSAYAVAKTAVIVAMLKAGAEPASVLEVWFSVGWTQGTREAFLAAIGVAATASDDVRVLLAHWADSLPWPLTKARTSWLTTRGKISNVANFILHEHVWDACAYLISGDVLGRGTRPVCGNTTMFDLPQSAGIKRAHNEHVLHTVGLEEFASVLRSPLGLMAGIVQLKVERITVLQDQLRSGVIAIQLVHGAVGPDHDAPLVKRLASLRPGSVQWSNCLDYIPTHVFHAVAKTIGDKDCVHGGYTMNWKGDMMGTNIVDFGTPARKEIMEQADQYISEVYKVHGIDDMLRQPPVDNAINYGSCLLEGACGKIWVATFMSEALARMKINFPEKGVCHSFYFPVESSNGCLDFSWTYDMDLPLQV